MSKWFRCCWYVTLIAICTRWGANMAAWGFWDWIAYGGIWIAAVVIAVDAAIAASDNIQKYIPRIFKIQYLGFFPLLCIIVSGGAFAYERLQPRDLLSLPADAKIGSPFGTVQAWGLNNEAFYMIIKTNRLTDNKNTTRLMLITRVQYSDIDKMTDKVIKKSQEYTIIEGFMTLALPVQNGPAFKVYANTPTPIEYDLVQIPSIFTPDQVTTLSDVENLGGKILATSVASSQFVSSSNPPAVCPPSPALPK